MPGRSIATVLLISACLSGCGGGSSGSATGTDSSAGTGNPPAPAADTKAPEVSVAQPTADATGIAIASTISVEFDEAIDESTIDAQSLVLTDQGVVVPGTLSYDPLNHRLNFVPEQPLAVQTVYQVALASSLHDVAGNAFAGATWFFTTGDAFNLGNTPQMTIDMCMSEGDKVMLTLVNNARAVDRACGSQQAPAQPALSWNCLLDQAARGHSTAMADNDFHAHINPIDGSDPGDRIAAVGYLAQAWGENVAAGYPDEDAVMAGWLDSPGHCSNIMSASFTEMGAAEASNPASTYGIYWTQKFARPRN